jgi:murein L,D-transpeptidase YcbB/YkuD
MKEIIISALMATHLFAFVDVTPSCCKQEIIQQTNEMSVENQMQVSNFYQNRSHNLMWDEEDLSDFLHATRDPLVNYLSFDYHQDEIEALMSRVDGDDSFGQRQALAQIDILATDGFLSLARDISEGLIDEDRFRSLLSEGEVHLVWEKSTKSKNYTSDLAIALRSNMLEALITRYLPLGNEYRNLVQAYHRYSDINLPKVDYGAVMKVGDYGYRASQLKAFLVATGDMKPQSDEYMEFPTYDENLAKALKRFQKRHYIKETGELDRVTVLYTRKSIEKKRELLKLNIERHKLFSKIYDKEYIAINIPEFSLKYFDHGSLIDDIFVVVGREDRPTPIFHDYLEYIVLNPSWIVPQNLMRKDYIPQLVDNPFAMEDEHIHIHKTPSRFSPEINPELVNWEKYLQDGVHIPYYFMQYPGEDNVLGQMKFIFPNKYNVYLHDTNSKGLTTLKYRLYSSGCIRLSRPFDLLHILSKYTKYSGDALVNMIESGKSVNVPLRKKIPIYIRYFTVFMNGGYAPSFRKDFYGIDALQLGSMRK